MREIRIVDKLIDELAKRKAMERILREGDRSLARRQRNKQIATVCRYSVAMSRRKKRRFLPWWMRKHRQKLRLRDAIRRRDGDICWQCHKPMRFGPPYNVGKAATIEHKLAEANGGTNALDNVVLCHVGCNRHLGVNSPEQKERMRLRR